MRQKINRNKDDLKNTINQVSLNDIIAHSTLQLQIHIFFKCTWNICYHNRSYTTCKPNLNKLKMIVILPNVLSSKEIQSEFSSKDFWKMPKYLEIKQHIYNLCVKQDIREIADSLSWVKMKRQFIRIYEVELR